MAVKVLLDTDIGSAIDDAVCLAYLLAQPECELLGITTVSGEATTRAMMASALCRVAGKDVPILPGAEAPLVISQRQPDVPQAAALDRWPHQGRSSFRSGEAVDFLRRTIRSHPGEVVLLAIGPLTNVALLFGVDPEIPGLLKALVLMGGRFADQQPSAPPEWNALLDPHAAAAVYRAQVAVHRSIGLDVTLQVTAPAEQIRQQFQSTLLRPVLDFADVWFRDRETITFHDPLAAATLFDDQICGFARGVVDVELSDPEAAGRTSWRPTEAGPHEVALGVDRGRFFDRFLSVFGQSPHGGVAR